VISFCNAFPCITYDYNNIPVSFSSVARFNLIHYLICSLLSTMLYMDPLL